jgi:RNA polymerase primary sigma factor
VKSFNNNGEIATAVNIKGQKKALRTEQSERLILAHMGFAEAIARKFKAKFPSVELDDLIQAGNVGLIEAARRFDTKVAQKRGAKFTTYAYPWIKKYIMQECEKTIYKLHVPDKVRRKVTHLRDLKSIYSLFLGREPTFNELVNYVKQEMRITKQEAEKYLRNVGAGGAEVYSLDRKINEDSNITFADVIEDPHRVEHTIADLLPEEVEKTLSTLSPRETRVLEVRFGIGTGRAYTLEEVAREFNVSTERIRQIEVKAFRKLRHPSRSRRLKDYLDEK